MAQHVMNHHSGSFRRISGMNSYFHPFCNQKTVCLIFVQNFFFKFFDTFHKFPRQIYDNFKTEAVFSRVQNFRPEQNLLAQSLNTLVMPCDLGQTGANIYGTSVHRGAFCQFLFRWIYYCHSSKSSGKETGKTHLCAVQW